MGEAHYFRDSGCFGPTGVCRECWRSEHDPVHTAPGRLTDQAGTAPSVDSHSAATVPEEVVEAALGAWEADSGRSYRERFRAALAVAEPLMRAAWEKNADPETTLRAWEKAGRAKHYVTTRAPICFDDEPPAVVWRIVPQIREVLAGVAEVGHHAEPR